MNIRKANNDDLNEIVRLLSDDKLGSKREDYKIPLPTEYLDAFKEIEEDKNQFLIVAEDENKIIGTLQLSFIQYLTYKGGIRAQIEGVRVSNEIRGKGIGRKMVEYAINIAKDRNAHLIQLTTDKKRSEALEFYKSLGFVDSHEGMKLHF
jgi:ribosomal protein S18 acetylase RimI-like enzyme